MNRGIENPPATTNAGHVMELARKAFVVVWNALSEEDKAKRIGGFFCFASVSDGGMFCGEVGQRDPEMFARFRFNAGEKIDRLDGRLREGYNDRSTFVTRDVRCDPKKYGGGIRAGNFFIAFSGLPEHGDEALCLCVAVWAGLIDFDDAKEIAIIGNNMVFFDLFNGGAIRSVPPG